MRVHLKPAGGDYSTDGRRLAVTSGVAAALGVVVAFVAKLLLAAIGLITNIAYGGRLATGLVAPDPHRIGPVAIAIPIVGALLVGLIARFFAEKIRGHGIPEAIQSILKNDSIVHARLVFWKPIASAIAIGTGSPFGAEGPIIMTGGGIGSLVAQFMHVSSFERRTLLVAGAAAGMSATFAAPIASVLIAVELLLFEWRPRSFVPVVVAAFVAEAVRVIIIGGDPPFVVAAVPSLATGDLAWALLLGLAGGAISFAMTRAIYVVEDAYERMPIHWMWWPAIGAVAVGVGGWFVPAALGVGYPTIDAMLDGRLAGGVVAGIVVVKIVIWVASLSSGTSGGVLAPLLMIGAAFGSLAGSLIPGGHASAWAIVGMAALMGGTMRAPFMGTLFALETTRAWGLAPDVFVGCVAATAFTVLFVPRSILTEKLARRGMHVAREYAVDPLEFVTVGDVMAPAFAPTSGAVAAVATSERVREVADRMATSDVRRFVVVDRAGMPVGAFGVEELLAAWKRGLHGERRRKRVRRIRRFWVRRAG